MSIKIGITQARRLLSGVSNGDSNQGMNELNTKRKANVFFNLDVDKSSSSSASNNGINGISLKRARSLLSQF